MANSIIMYKHQQIIFAVTNIFLFIIIFFIIYFNGIQELTHRWIEQEEYSHAFFIPLLVAFLIYSKRDQIFSDEESPSWLGVILSIFALLVLFVGELSAIYIFTQYSLVLLLLGLILSLVGKRVFKLIFIPVLILLFSIPLPYFLESGLTWKLQLVSSKIGVEFIRLLGIPVYLQGNIIDLGNYKLQVIEACSGLNYLYPLMSIGFIVAYIFKAPFKYKSLIFLSTIPITILMNSLRIGMVGILVSYGGSTMAEGFLHYFEGWLIFLICLCLLILEIWLLTKIMPNKPTIAEVLTIYPVIKTSHTKKLKFRFSLPYIVTLILIIFAALSIGVVSNRTENLPDRIALDKFPVRFNEWKLIKSNLTPSIIQQLKFDDYFIGNYINENDKSVELYIAFYKSQRKGVSPHSPRVCIPGGGWHINEIKREVLELENGYQLPVNRIIIENNHMRKLVYYWFDQRGRSITNEYVMKWYLLKDAIFKNRTDGALIRLSTDLNVNEADINADKRITQLIKSIYPMLSNYIPK